MKGLLVFVLAAAALVVGLWLVGRRPPEADPKSSASDAPAIVVRTPAPAAPDSDRARAASSVPESGGGAVGSPSDFGPDRARMEEVARRARVAIVRYEPSARSVIVAVSWQSDVMTQGMDFIEGLLREGLIRDFEPVGPGLKQASVVTAAASWSRRLRYSISRQVPWLRSGSVLDMSSPHRFDRVSVRAAMVRTPT